jgi:hypothetical protein
MGGMDVSVLRCLSGGNFEFGEGWYEMGNREAYGLDLLLEFVVLLRSLLRLTAGLFGIELHIGVRSLRLVLLPRVRIAKEGLDGSNARG